MAARQPPAGFAAHTKSDTVRLPSKVYKIRVGSIAGGAVVVIVNGAGDATTFTAVAGEYIDCPGAQYLNATSTTASEFIAYWTT